MPISTQDLTHGVDFTTLAPNQTASEHNQLIDQSVPTNDGDDTVGRALVITSTDTAVGVPSVPNANTFTKWKRYLWARRPNPSDTSAVSTVYAWNDSAVLDATLLKWVATVQDLTAIEAAIAQAESDAATALSTANAANGTASIANNAAQQALSLANAANTTAQVALSTANTSTAAAATASANAAAAQVTASAALAAATAPESITNIVIGTFPGQRIRSNQTNTQLEYYKIQDELVQIVYQDTFGVIVDASNNANTQATWQRFPVTVVYNNKLTDTGALSNVNFSTGRITLQPGIYKFKAKHKLSVVFSSAFAMLGYFTVDLTKDTDNTILQTGVACNTASTELDALTEGTLVITTASGPLTVRFDLVMNIFYNGGGSRAFTLQHKFGNYTPTTGSPGAVATTNIYGFVEFQRIGFQ